MQVLADVAAADAFAAKGASDIDARQMQATLRSLVEDAMRNSSVQAATSPPANAQQAMLRYALARHGEPQCTVCQQLSLGSLTQQLDIWKAGMAVSIAFASCIGIGIATLQSSAVS